MARIGCPVVSSSGSCRDRAEHTDRRFAFTDLVALGLAGLVAGDRGGVRALRHDGEPVQKRVVGKPRARSAGMSSTRPGCRATRPVRRAIRGVVQLVRVGPGGRSPAVAGVATAGHRRGA